MDIRELRLFYILRRAAISAKPRRPCISARRHSRQIQRLEESLGIRCFCGIIRTVQLTAAGEQLKKFAQETVLQHSAAATCA